MSHLHRQVGMKYTSYLPAYENGTDIVFRNVSIQNSDAGKLPRRKFTTTNVIFVYIRNSPEINEIKINPISVPSSMASSFT
jgi:hypothetical protein